ncbi:MAG: SDR family oxidoreductase [Gemmatimonadaceae bacterium]
MDARVVVITGASSGIGAALALRLGARGDAVVVVARRRDVLREVAARCGANALVVVGDVTQRDDVRRVVKESLARFGGVDAWVNNAGQGITRVPSELTDDDIDEMITVNVKSALYGMQEILPHFKERGTGHVINVSSLLGRVPMATFRAAYSGSKHFLNSLTTNFRMEVQETHPGIQFSIVSPGVVRTEFGVNARYGGPDSRELPGSQSAEEVAEVIAGVLDSRHPDVYTASGAKERIAGYFAAMTQDFS